MQRLKALDELTPADLWREVPHDDEAFWSDARERQRHLVKVLIEGALEEEMTLLLGGLPGRAGRYRRTGAHDQCHRALLPGSPQADSSHDLFQQQRQL